MLDLVAALEWIRDNIAGFGGDPGSVTIFGQSGGGRKVSTLLAMPAARGLFHKAAILSGSHLRQGSPEGTAKLAAAVLANLGVTAASLDKLADVSTEQLLRAGIEAQRSLSQPGGGAAAGWGPVVDGAVLPQHAFDPASPAISAAVPVLVGNTFVEFGGGMGNPDARAMTTAQVRERLSPMLGAKTDEVVASYQKIFPKAPPFEISGIVQGSQRYRLDAITLAERKAAQNGAPVYSYWFGWRTPVLDGRPLAYHCQDLAFWFDNIDLAAQATGGGDDARELATTMSSAFVAFARTGNPSTANGPQWPAFTAADRQMMIFDNGQSSARRDPDIDARRLLQAALAR
jgi:para-nitrobenzyl esterase